MDKLMKFSMRSAEGWFPSDLNITLETINNLAFLAREGADDPEEVASTRCLTSAVVRRRYFLKNKGPQGLNFLQMLESNTRTKAALYTSGLAMTSNSDAGRHKNDYVSKQ